MTIAEMKKAEVLTYLEAAAQQLSQAQLRLAGQCELRNEIYTLVVSPLNDLITAIEEAEFEDDFRLKSK